MGRLGCSQRHHRGCLVPRCGQWYAGTHTECLLLTTADTVTIRDNRFRNCGSTGSIYATEINTDSPNGDCQNVTIENNMFLGRDDGSNDYVHLESDCGILLRNNSFSRGARPYLLDWQNHPGDGPTRTIVAVGNYGNAPAVESGWNCSSPPSNVAFSDNVWLNKACSSSDLSVGTLNFVNPASDLHLVAGANAIDQASMTNYASTDVDGQARYSGSAPDAGADER